MKQAFVALFVAVAGGLIVLFVSRVTPEVKPPSASTPSAQQLVAQPTATVRQVPQPMASQPTVQPTAPVQSAGQVPGVQHPAPAVPATLEEAARRWGGQASWWTRLESNGWKLQGSLTLKVDRDWRVDYIDTDGNVKSCGDSFEPGVYGPATVNVTAATLWYVPGETRCPSWTIWSKSHS